MSPVLNKEQGREEGPEPPTLIRYGVALGKVGKRDNHQRQNAQSHQMQRIDSGQPGSNESKIGRRIRQLAGVDIGKDIAAEDEEHIDAQVPMPEDGNANRQMEQRDPCRRNAAKSGERRNVAPLAREVHQFAQMCLLDNT
jgi:hypothetical protein